MKSSKEGLHRGLTSYTGTPPNLPRRRDHLLRDPYSSFSALLQGEFYGFPGPESRPV